MKHISQMDMTKAIAVVTNVIRGDENKPILQPEQVQQILSIQQEPDPLVRSAKTIEAAQEVIKEVAALQESRGGLIHDAGMARDRLTAMMDGDPTAARSMEKAGTAIEEALQNWECDLREEASRVVMQIASVGRSRELPSIHQRWA